MTVAISMSRYSTPLPSTLSSPTPTLPPPAYLSVIPSLLQPVSPHLSALHAARVQLLFNLPKEATQKWCCSKCGCLREGFGWKVTKVKKDARVEDGPSGRVVKGGAVKRSASDMNDDTPSSPESSHHKRRTTTSTQPPKNMLRGICPMCGTKFSLVGSDRKTVESFPPARRTRKTSCASPYSQVAFKGVETPGEPLEATTQLTSTTLHTPSSGSAPTKPPPTLLASPSLAHIPLSHPVTSASPFPTMLPSSLPPSSTSSRSASPVGGLPKNSIPLVGPSTSAVVASGKRKKKSGLAKLLAESKRKEEEVKEGFGGLGKSWGLG